MILNEISEAFDSKGSDSMERREKRSFEELSDDPTVNARLNVEAKFGANAEEFEYWFLQTIVDIREDEVKETMDVGLSQLGDELVPQLSTLFDVVTQSLAGMLKSAISGSSFEDLYKKLNYFLALRV